MVLEVSNCALHCRICSVADRARLCRSQAPLELTKRVASPPSARRGAAPPVDTGWWPRPPGRQQFINEHGQPKLLLSTNHLMFPRTPLGVPRSLTLQLTNLSQEVIKWNMFGYSMPYLITVRSLQ